MSKLQDVTESLLNVCAQVVPEVKWGVAVIGANVGKEPEGTVSCDKVSFEHTARRCVLATAEFSVYVIDINANIRVEDIGDKLFDALMLTDFDGSILVGKVKNISYGTPKGVSKAVAMVLEFEAQFPM